MNNCKPCEPREIRLLKALAQGIDPFTGEVLQENSPFNQAETVRVLYKAINAIERQMEREKKRSKQPNNAGKPWSKDLLQQLEDDFHRGFSVDHLAAKYQRTRWAIESKLLQLSVLNQQLKPKDK